jgi:tetratricopeptide (TPR) repeat protein
VLLALLLPGLAAAAAGQPRPVSPLAQANAALQAGEADKALGMIDSALQANPALAEAHNLKCRVLLTLERFDPAAAECEQAVNLDGQSSIDHLWLGRALGERADRASFLNAYSLAKRTRAEFEEAVRLDPRNADALADLGEFYSEAPGVVGGGVDKAEGIAAQLDKVDAPRAYELRAHIAGQRKDQDAAERELKLAIGVSPHPASQWMTLAGFYRRRERWADMDSALQSGMTAAERDKHAADALYDGASVLIRANRNPALAARMLEEYLASQSKTEEAPAFQAYLRLARIREQQGDAEAAKRAREAATALAHDYTPAQAPKH